MSPDTIISEKSYGGIATGNFNIGGVEFNKMEVIVTLASNEDLKYYPSDLDMFTTD